MTGKELDYVRGTIDSEGFDYAFIHDSDFTDTVKDKEFHRLREAYVKAHDDLKEYLGEWEPS